jgi:hypothetical protein
MHVYGNMRPPGSMIDRVPVVRAPQTRSVTLAPAAWPAPRISTWVDLPAPSPWAAPDPELLLSITIAPLRFAPVSWAPPTVITSPWGPPVLSTPSTNRANITTETAARPRRRRFALAMMALAAAGLGTVAAVIVNL